MYRWLYSLLLYLYIPFELIRLLRRSRKAPDYKKRWGERFASTLPNCDKPVIWFHTVSVGETLAALPVIRRVIQDNPDKQVLVTTMTPTGSERVQATLGDSVCHCYAPYDLPHALNRFYEHLKPECLFIMETELWPNMIHHASKRNIPIVLMNARMSEKSARDYQRFSTLTRFMLGNLAQIAVQNETDANRFKRLGASDDQLSITGNIKFDLTIPDDLNEKVKTLKKSLSDRPIWLAASTHKGEDEIILNAHKEILQKTPDCLLILVPRHPERFNDVYKLCEEFPMEVSRRSSLSLPRGQVYLADTMGELLLFCALADMAYVGGSLVETGGHNCLEVAAFKKPAMSGPYDFNFAEINKQLKASGGLVYVSGSHSIADQVISWIEQPEKARQVGEAGFSVVQKNRGALQRLLEILNQYL